MTCRWLVDAVVRVDIDGVTQILYQGLEFKVLEDNDYINNAIALKWAEEVKEEQPPIEVTFPEEP